MGVERFLDYLKYTTWAFHSFLYNPLNPLLIRVTLVACVFLIRGALYYLPSERRYQRDVIHNRSIRKQCWRHEYIVHCH